MSAVPKKILVVSHGGASGCLSQRSGLGKTQENALPCDVPTALSLPSLQSICGSKILLSLINAQNSLPLFSF